MKFHVRILLWTGTVLSWVCKVTGNRSWKKVSFLPYLFTQVWDSFTLCFIIIHFFLSSSFFPLITGVLSFWCTCSNICMLAFLRILSFLKVSNLFSHYHPCYINLMLKMIFLTFLLAFPQTCLAHIPLLAVGSPSYLIEIMVFSQSMSRLQLTL